MLPFPVEGTGYGIFNVLGTIFTGIANFAWWFYSTFLPFVLQYIAIPMFALGILMALAFAGGTMAFTIVFFVFLYFFIKGTIFDTKP